MAQALEIELTVAGVENIRQLQVMQEFGDCLIRGLLVGESLPATEFEAFYRGYASDLPNEAESIAYASNK